MIVGYYAVTFVISFLLWAFFIVSCGQKKMNINLVIIFSVVAVSNGGYLALSLAEDLDIALLAQKIVYLAVIYAPLFIFFNVCALCKVNLHKIVRMLLVLLCSIVYVLILTAGYSKLYYKEVFFHNENGYAYITKTYGPTHFLYDLALYGVIGASVVVLVLALRNQKKVSVKNSGMLLAILAVMIIAFFGKKILGTNVEFMPAVYCFLVMIFLAVYRRVDMYDIGYAILDTLEQQMNGYIVLNKKLNYLGSNEMARMYYPALEDMKIDRSVETDSRLFFQIRKKVQRLEDVSFVEWNKRVNGYTLKCTIRAIYRDNVKRGYLLQLVDDTKHQQYIKQINTYNSELEEAMDMKSRELIEIQNKIILGMANVVESRDNSTGGHIKRTSEVVKIFVEKLRRSKLEYKIEDEILDDVIKAAPMHDLGKIAIDDSILRKPGKFTPKEYEEMKKHAKEGVVIIDSVLDGVEDKSFVQVARNIAHYHHEKYDGSGYPDGLKGENIPLEARIMALADVFDALVSKRCYKDEYSYDKAFNIIEESLGNHFDPVLGKIFIECRPKLETYYDSVEE